MTTFDEDKESLQVMLDDFADEYGDQALIEGMQIWLNEKMGVGQYYIISSSQLDKAVEMTQRKDQ